MRPGAGRPSRDVSLDVKGLTKGTYTVNVNGVTATFDLAVDTSDE